MPLLKRLVKDNYDQRHRATLPHQYTDELLLLAYAFDGKQHAMFWLCPASEETDPFSPILRHWQSAVPIRADILPGMHFFDAWRIFPTMQIESDDHEDLESFEGVLPPREKWEFRAQTDARTDAQADAVAKRYRPWPKGLRADSLPWFDSPLVQGASRLRYTDKAQMQRPGHTGRKALATKKRRTHGCAVGP